MLISLFACHVCGNSEGNIVYKVREMMFGFRDEFRYFECRICGCLQIFDVPADTSKYYPQGYYSYAKITESTSSYSLTAAKASLARKKQKYELLGGGFLDALVYRSLRLVSGPTGLASYSTISLVPLTRNSRILDVGCGSGLLLYVLRELGFENLLGCDPFIDKTIKYRNGLEILKMPIYDIRGKWDLVMFHHSFEHIADQVETLRTTCILLADDGVCLIRAPTASSYAWKHYRENWVGLDAPRHYFLHSVESLRILAEKAGLRLKQVVYDSTALQFFGSEQYVRDIPLHSRKSYCENPADSIFSGEQIREFERKAAELNRKNLGDQAAFLLNRP